MNFDLNNPKDMELLEGLYGYTEDIAEGGFILPNGKMLNTRPNSDRGHRCHDSIVYLAGADIKHKKEFIGLGVIRTVVHHGYFEMRRLPTDSQIEIMLRMMRHWGGKVLIDMHHGNEEATDSRGYLIGHPLISIIGEIRDFFKNDPA